MIQLRVKLWVILAQCGNRGLKYAKKNTSCLKEVRICNKKSPRTINKHKTMVTYQYL